MNLADMRTDYRRGRLRREDLKPDPIVQFNLWLEEAWSKRSASKEARFQNNPRIPYAQHANLRSSAAGQSRKHKRKRGQHLVLLLGVTLVMLVPGLRSAKLALIERTSSGGKPNGGAWSDKPAVRVRALF
jgi:hypothetical protein